MANEEDNNFENLTTDACPSPPREDNQMPEPEFTEEIKQESNPYTRNKQKKSKSKKIPTQVANVININNCNGIHVGSVYTYNIAKPQTVEDTGGKEIIKTKAICELLQQTDDVTTKIISFVSKHIGKNWRVVARTLGYSEGQIDQYYEKYSTVAIREVVYQILLDWIQNKPAEAKVGLLFTALWNAPEKDVVRRMADKAHTQ